MKDRDAFCHFKSENSSVDYVKFPDFDVVLHQAGLLLCSEISMDVWMSNLLNWS